MFDLVYVCSNCSSSIPVKTIDGRVCPPPDTCDMCLTPSDELRQEMSHKRESGQIHKGVQLIRKSHSGQWVCLCLWCKNIDLFLLRQSNVGNQASCGCLRRNKLKINHWGVEEGVVNCTCRDCGLTYNYDLRVEGPISCANGC